MKLKFIFPLILFCLSIKAQNKIIDHQQLLWYGYIVNADINKKWFVVAEIQERHFIASTRQHQLVFRTHLHKKLDNDTDIGLGMCLFYQGANSPTVNYNKTSPPELRPHFEVNTKHKIYFVSIAHRYKAEARFFKNNDNYSLSNLRLRYQLGLSTPLFTTSNKTQVATIKLQDEIMFNLGNKIVANIFDQNRLYLGINFKVSKPISLEIGYLNILQQQVTGINFYDRDIIRFTIFHTI